MSADEPFVEIQGLKELSRTLKKMENGKELAAELKGASRKVSEIVVSAAQGEVPVRSGRLRDSIKPNASPTGAGVKAGSTGVPYAGPIHFGWNKRGIAANPFIYRGVDKTMDEIVRVYEEETAKLFELGESD